MPTIHLVIKGKVQGVFYRASTRKFASAAGITGWVRNKDNGDVEVMASGNERQLLEFKNWCRSGPEQAMVTEVIETIMEEIKFDSFSVRH